MGLIKDIYLISSLLGHTLKDSFPEKQQVFRVEACFYVTNMLSYEQLDLVVVFLIFVHVCHEIRTLFHLLPKGNCSVQQSETNRQYTVVHTENNNNNKK